MLPHCTFAGKDVMAPFGSRLAIAREGTEIGTSGESGHFVQCSKIVVLLVDDIRLLHYYYIAGTLWPQSRGSFHFDHYFIISK